MVMYMQVLTMSSQNMNYQTYLNQMKLPLCSKQKWRGGTINKCSQGPYRTVHSAQGPFNIILCTGEILTGPTVHIYKLSSRDPC